MAIQSNLTEPGHGGSEGEFDPKAITRPDPALWTYYLVTAALTVVAFPIVILPMYFKYRTLKYRFDDEGVSMAWGILFRKEVYLTYRRIQDIHVSRNFIQRWMGLATVAVQTASGSSAPEMSIEGILQPDALRDFLYQKMRGAKGLDAPARETAGAAAPADLGDEALVLLRDIRDSLAAAPGTGGRS